MRLIPVAKGNAITEYALPALLILVVSMGMLQVLGGNLNGVFSTLKGEMKQSIQHADVANMKHAQAMAALNQASASAANASGRIPATKVCDASGNCVSVTSAIDLKSTIVTLGANGAINVMADKLKILAAQMLATGQITAAQAGIFNDLANQGYKIGVISGLVEQTAKSCGSNSACFTSKTVNYNGQQVNMSDLSNMIGYKPLAGGDTQNNPQVDALWNIYKSLPNEVWTDPALKGTVTTLTTQIAQTSNLVMWGTSNIQNGYNPPSGMESYIIGQAGGTIPQSGVVQGNVAQGVINGNATTTCVVGNGSSNGTSCH